MTAAPACSVYYDGACPLCRREIAFYRGKRGADTIRWVDISVDTTSEHLGPDLTPEAAKGRFHVRDGGGRLQSGAAGFAALWSALPGFRPIGRIAGLPPLVWALEVGYRGFLCVRPWLQRRLGTSECPAVDPDGG